MEQPANPNLFDLHLDQTSINYLNEAARWAKFLSIIGFIYCGLLVIGGLMAGTIITMMMPAMSTGDAMGMSAMGSIFIGIVVILVAVLLFFPAYFLFSFASKLRRASRTNDQVVLSDALKNLKSFFKFYGILVIIALSFYILVFIAAIFGALVGARH